MPPFKSYAEVIERPLFSPSRRPPREATKSNVKPWSALVLTGIIVTSEVREAFMVHRMSPTAVPLREGQTIDGWTIRKIGADRVIIGNDGVRHELRLPGTDSDGAPAGPSPSKQILGFFPGRIPDARPLRAAGTSGGATSTIDAPAAIRRMVTRLAPLYRLRPALVLAVIKVESDFRSDAVSPADAQGLMQLIPATQHRFGVTDPFDTEQNLHGGMAYLRWLLDRFGGDVTRALAAYNAGEQAVDRYDGLPPYDETRDYIAKFRRLGIVPDSAADDGTIHAAR